MSSSGESVESLREEIFSLADRHRALRKGLLNIIWATMCALFAFILYRMLSWHFWRPTEWFFSSAWFRFTALFLLVALLAFVTLQKYLASRIRHRAARLDALLNR